MTITILDSSGFPMTEVTEAVAHKLEATFQVTATTDPSVRRFLSADQRDAARKGHVRRVTGLAHPHDKCSDQDIDTQFDAWERGIGQEVFV